MSLYKNSLEILKEACDGEDLGLDDADLDDVEVGYEDIVGDIEELDDEELGYTEEMVNVIEQQTSNGNRYLVEADSLAKYMLTQRITDVAEAMGNIAECNKLDVEAMCLVIESDDYMMQLIEEARKIKRAGGKTGARAAELKSTVDVIKMVKTKGIKVVKKKSRKKKKRK